MKAEAETKLEHKYFVGFILMISRMGEQSTRDIFVGTRGNER